jgi:hypothetical protein
MVGDDIQNPFQTVVSATYLIKDDLASLPQNETKASLIESMKEIEDQANYISKTAANLQDYSRSLSLSNEEIDLRNLIDSLLIRTELAETIKITSDLANNTQNIKADPDYIKRINTILKIDAEQAMPDGGTITIKAHKQEGTCFITVEDTDGGISENIKPRIFRPLFTTKSKGQGFGLAVSKRHWRRPRLRKRKGKRRKIHLKTAQLPTKHLHFLSGMKSIEIEFTQWRVFFFVKPSAKNTCPKCAPQVAQIISVRTPSASKIRFTPPGISSSKLGHPQSASNLLSERYNAAPQRLHTYVPFSQNA